MRISLLHATFGRPEKALKAMRDAMRAAAYPDLIEYAFGINSDDPTTFNFEVMEVMRGRNAMIASGPFKGSAAAWDSAAMLSTGELLVQMQDDLELPKDWDATLVGLYCGLGDPAQQTVIAVSDGYRKDELLCTAICNRARYNKQGEFLHRGYQSVYSDDEFTYRAKRDARDGICDLLDAKKLIFRHRHHYHDGSVPMDDTYRRENSDEAYKNGQELFSKRNPTAATDGLKTW